MQTIDTAPLNNALQEWGVAVMSVQANIPNTLPGQAVSFILLGDVEIENAVPVDDAVEAAAQPIPVTSLVNANIRSLPTTNANIVGSVATGAVLEADAINPQKDWLRVVFDERTPGWISRELVETSGDLDSLPVFERATRTPMQAFYFRTGIGEPSCNESPDVLVVQGPQSVSVDITANGADIRIGSTIALRTPDGSQMQIMTISGEATVGGITIPRGYMLTVPLDENGQIINNFDESDLTPIPQELLDDLQWLEGLPNEVLNYPIVVNNFEPPPLSQ
ncbi:MAG: SH3 domain-containing protein, partial [Anaerolineae bacterium]|nr:SH3 domain-containing protein [Anaerolineae bacterium]